jgi:hypothetical protein
VLLVIDARDYEGTMARKDNTAETGSTPDAIIGLLARAADGDTLFRDLYLLRARELLAPVFTESRYHGVAGEREEAERSLAQARLAAGRRDWERVRDLSNRAASLQRALQTTQDVCALAESIYDAPTVALDPFSPGVVATRGKDARSVHADVVDALGKLETADATKAALYAARRAAVTALVPAAASPGASKPAQTESIDQRLRVAAERGDADQLRQLAEQMLAGSSANEPTDGETTAKRARFEAPRSLGEPFPQASIERAGALGLEHVQSREVSGVAAAVREFLDHYGWGPATPELGKAKEGVTQLRALAKEHMSSPEVAELAAETVSLFATQVFVNSAGLRYVPLPVDTEPCLVEAAKEGEDGPPDLLKALALPARRGLARTTIESALLLHGPAVLEERLGLDPREFRLVCIPPEIYLRVGRERSWGGRPEWTHFDGYRVLKGGRLLALVGGNSRYGGLVDLAGISSTDERENVVARFAVVRRARLGARPPA